MAPAAPRFRHGQPQISALQSQLPTARAYSTPASAAWRNQAITPVRAAALAATLHQPPRPHVHYPTPDCPCSEVRWLALQPPSPLSKGRAPQAGARRLAPHRLLHARKRRVRRDALQPQPVCAVQRRQRERVRVRACGGGTVNVGWIFCTLRQHAKFVPRGGGLSRRPWQANAPWHPHPAGKHCSANLKLYDG